MKQPILPLAVPDLKEVKSFANHLHSPGKYWQGGIFGWQPEYTRRAHVVARYIESSLPKCYTIAVNGGAQMPKTGA
jgi:hypothetical protein